MACPEDLKEKPTTKGDGRRVGHDGHDGHDGHGILATEIDRDTPGWYDSLQQASALNHRCPRCKVGSKKNKNDPTLKYVEIDSDHLGNHDEPCNHAFE